MTVEVACTDCEWWADREPTEIPPRCPRCHASVERASSAVDDDGTWHSGEV